MKEIILSLINLHIKQYLPEWQVFESLHLSSHVKNEPMNWKEASSKLFNSTIRGGRAQVSEIGSNWSNILVGMNALWPMSVSCQQATRTLISSFKGIEMPGIPLAEIVRVVFSHGCHELDSMEHCLPWGQRLNLILNS